MMIKPPKITIAERVGRALARTRREGLRQEARAVRWMVGRGVPTDVAKALPWVLKLLVLAVLLHAALWVALLLVFAVITAWVAVQDRQDDGDDWSFSTLDELRKTPGYDPVPYNDIEHPDFPDEKGN